ncbi:MAG TPA: glycosyltransferase [Puia sp.]|nr:glycosyltransferase [Puia sp.]
MKYWLLTTEFPPAHGGGISTYCRCTAEMLAGKGVAVTVIVADDSVDDYSLTSFQRHLVIARFNPARRGVPRELGGAAGLSYAFLRMAQLMVRELGEPDIIESQDYLGIAYYIQQFQLLGYPSFKDIPVLITIHAPAFVYLPYNGTSVYRFPDFWTCEMEKHSIRSADMVISPSRFMAAEVGRHLDYGQRPIVLPYAYRPCDPHSAAGDRDRAVRRNKIVYYGKLSPQKGSFELLAYFKALWDDGFPHPLHIIGGDDIVYQPELLTMGQLVHRRYGSYIRKKLLCLHGKIDPAAIPTALADAHVVLVPSVVDNLPFVCLETMACGKVVLASVQGGQSEIITDGVNGFLFDHREPESFGRKLKQVLALSDEEILRIGRTARASLDRYDYDLIAPKKIALLKELRKTYSRRKLFPFLRPGPAPAPLPEKPFISNMLSVVIPYYNLGAYLDECVLSILNSRWERTQIIIVNDGSSEPGSLAALERWRKHPAITVIDTPNRGLAQARNAGAAQAAGAYLSFLDADDAVRPDYYEKAIRVLDQYKDVYFVGSWVEYFGDSAGVWPAFPPERPYLLAHNPINSSALVYKTAAFLQAGLNDGQLVFGLEDYESVVRMARHSFNGVVLPEPLHRYRVRQGSMIRAMNRNKLLLAHTYITEKHREFYQPYMAEVIQLLNSNGPGYLFENPTLQLYVNSSRDRWNWVNAVKRIARRHPALKKFILLLKKKTDWIWHTPPHAA